MRAMGPERKERLILGRLGVQKEKPGKEDESPSSPIGSTGYEAPSVLLTRLSAVSSGKSQMAQRG